MTSTAPTAPMPALPATTAASLPLDRHPAAVYLASLADGPGRASMRSTLSNVAAMLGSTIDACPWHELRFAHVAALRTQLAAQYAPATANRYLSAIRQVCRQAWLLGWMDGEEYRRIAAVENVRGSRLPAGRTLDAGELAALMRACRDDTAAGARDAAAVALMFGCGMRRAEAVAVTVADYDPESGALRVIGKGNRERQVYATNGGKRALDAWLAVRGDAPGPILCPVGKGAAVRPRPGVGMTAGAVVKRLALRARQAGIGTCSPHDLRRSFVSAALEGGADIAMVQRLAGHASPATTARHDRRLEHAAAIAARVVHVPY